MIVEQITAGFQKVSLPEVPLFDFVGDNSVRWSRTRQFLGNFLNQYKNPKILDLAMGSGPDTIALLKEGCDVTSNEVDEYGIGLAQVEAKKENVKLNIRKIFWEQINHSLEYRDSEFDLAFSLGNSFPNYLLNERDRVEALKGFWKVIKPGGTLIFDARNFDYMLREKEFILQNPEENFKYTYSTTYTGQKVKGFPVEIENDKIHFVWKHYDNKKYAELHLWPATIENVKKLVQSALGKVEISIFFNYQKEKSRHYDFAQFVIRKL